ncbi:fused DSP-PTPase phosphatase/NAD kinase-like protein [Natronospirillum operosum]|nr:tyrosine-protein phosphatase [Natronospirillum operosum]
MGRSAYRRWRDRLPERMHSRAGRFWAWLDMMVVDHGFMRPFFNRPEQVVPGIWRSNQPTPGRLRRLTEQQGIKAVLNLRGESTRGAYALEKHTCDELGLDLIDLHLASRRPPHPQQVEALLQVLDSAPRPLLLHCKSGADRAGLASALVLHLAGGSDDAVRRQLSMRYLHIRQAQTGVLDDFLERYLTWHAETGGDLAEWVQHHYDRAQVKREFKPSGWANVLVDRLLRRE